MHNNQTLFQKIKEIFLHSDAPSAELQELLKDDKVAKAFPELIALKDIRGCPKYHPEGSVFEHTMQTLDASAEIEDISQEEKFILMLAALCHDFGKVIRQNCSEEISKYDDGHDVAGVPLAKKFLERLTQDEKIIKPVCKFVRYHLLPLKLFEKIPAPKEFHQIYKQLAPEISLKQLFMLSWCDARGTNPNANKPLSKGAALTQLLQDNVILRKFMQNINRIQIEGAPPIPLLFEADLLEITSPGEKVEDLIRKAYQIQIDEGITNREELLLKLRASGL